MCTRSLLLLSGVEPVVESRAPVPPYIHMPVGLVSGQLPPQRVPPSSAPDPFPLRRSRVPPTNPIEKKKARRFRPAVNGNTWDLGYEEEGRLGTFTSRYAVLREYYTRARIRRPGDGQLGGKEFRGALACRLRLPCRASGAIPAARFGRSVGWTAGIQRGMRWHDQLTERVSKIRWRLETVARVPAAGQASFTGRQITCEKEFANHRGDALVSFLLIF